MYIYIYIYVCMYVLSQGQDGVDLEMNLNENKYRLEDSEFSDVVRHFLICTFKLQLFHR